MATYILFIKINKDLKIKVGSLGILKFRKGIYAYVGSAKKNWKSRIKRHFSKNKKIHWHIDYLTSNKFVNPYAVYIIEKNEESKIASLMLKYGEPIIDFGSSDTKDISHLFKLKPKNL